MKKIAALFLSVVISFSLVACNTQADVISPQNYPLENKTVTDILNNNGFDLNAYVSRYDDTDKTGYTYAYTIDNFDENYECEGEPSIYGVLQLEWDGEDGKSVKMICMEDESEFADISNYDNLRKSVYTVCDVYGGIENKKQIADDFISALKDGKIFADALPVWNAEYNGIFVNADFLPAHDDMPVTFRKFEIYDRTRKDWYDSRDERALKIIVDMNPYMYTLKELDHPDALTKEQVNNIISGNQWGLSVSELIDENQTAGAERDIYQLALPDGTPAATAAVHYNKSGKSTSFSYRIADTDISRSDAGVEFAVKTACSLYGDIDNVDGLAEKVKTAINNKDFEYNQYNDPHCLIEQDGIYCMLIFGKIPGNNYEFTGLNIYNKDSLQAGIYAVAKNDTWYQKIYSELFE